MFKYNDWQSSAQGELKVEIIPFAESENLQIQLHLITQQHGEKSRAQRRLRVHAPVCLTHQWESSTTCRG